MFSLYLEMAVEGPGIPLELLESVAVCGADYSAAVLMGKTAFAVACQDTNWRTPLAHF